MSMHAQCLFSQKPGEDNHTDSTTQSHRDISDVSLRVPARLVCRLPSSASPSATRRPSTVPTVVNVAQPCVNGVLRMQCICGILLPVSLPKESYVDHSSAGQGAHRRLFFSFHQSSFLFPSFFFLIFSSSSFFSFIYSPVKSPFFYFFP